MEDREFLRFQSILESHRKLNNAFYLNQLQSYLCKIKFFDDLSKDFLPEDYTKCIKCLKLAIFCSGDVISENEQILDKVYIIVKGTVLFRSTFGSILRVYEEGLIFGESLLNAKTPKGFDIISEEDTTLVYFSSYDYKKLLERYREHKRIALVNFLGAQKSFVNWRKSNIMELIPYLIEKVYEKGETVFYMNEAADKIFIVIDGEVILFKEIAKRVSVGAIIGLEDLQENQVRSYSCVASTRSTLLLLSKSDYPNFQGIWEMEKTSGPSVNSRRRSIIIIDNLGYNHKRRRTTLLVASNPALPSKPSTSKSSAKKRIFIPSRTVIRPALKSFTMIPKPRTNQDSGIPSYILNSFSISLESNQSKALSRQPSLLKKLTFS